MKTKQMLILASLAFGLLVGREAQAYYNPSSGRWLSRDPIQESGGKNLYGFARNDAIDHWDKFGKCVNSSGGKKAFGGGFRFDAGLNHADVSVAVADKDYCNANEINVVFNFYTDYDETTDETLRQTSEFTCNGNKATPSGVRNPPPEHDNGKEWSVTCKLGATKCNSMATGVTLGIRGVTREGGPMENVGTVNASINYSCDCPCKMKGCVNVELSATGNRQ